jgi:hypothetical protein
LIALISILPSAEYSSDGRHQIASSRKEIIAAQITHMAIAAVLNSPYFVPRLHHQVSG